MLDIIFLPGFSTAEQVSDVSGRGVGMDVVKNNIAAVSGTVETVENISMDDLKAYYDSFISPSISTLMIVGDVNKDQILESFSALADAWEAKDVTIPEVDVEYTAQPSKIYIVDFPGAKQSVIRIGSLYKPVDHNDYYASTVANYKLGGSFNGNLNMILREEKGFTYGARSYFDLNNTYGVFAASSSVRSDATLESVEIFRDEMAKYREGIPAEDLEFTKDALLKSNALNYETLGAIQGMLYEINEFDLPVDYIDTEQNILKNMTLEQHKELCQKYINPDEMFYVIIGDAASQMKPLEKVGYGKPEVISLD